MLAVLVFSLVALPSPAAGAAPAQNGDSSQAATKQVDPDAVVRQGEEIDEEQEHIHKLTRQVEKNNTISLVILAPIAVLVGILALGGSLGIVFSVRDQRRVSQLHELTVGGEMMSQRRAEQTYASFFEQSQTTLSLVNDTLELAKEANLRANESMKKRAKEQVDVIAEGADDLLQRVFRDGDFEKIVYESEYRTQLHAIADELRAMEGFLRLQDIQPPPHVNFIKAIAQFLDDDTEAALRGLRQLAQSSPIGELQRFTLFWLGYLSTTVGEYESAIRTFRDDEAGLDKDDTERFQLECIIAETRFFDKAKKLRQGGDTDKPEKSVNEPLGRLAAVAPLLDELTDLAFEVAVSRDSRERHHVSLEIARTRADIYIWIAYDPDLHKQLDPSARDPLEGLPDLSGPPREIIRGDVDQLDSELEASTQREKGKEDGAVRFAGSTEADVLSENTLQMWALLQALQICNAQHDLNFDVAFARAECYFKLGENEAAAPAIREAEDYLHNEFGDYMEQRRKASLRQCELICHRWLLHLEQLENPHQPVYGETRNVRQAAKHALEAASEMHQSRVTIFSQIQRRNVNRPEFVKEAEAVAAIPGAGTDKKS
jgi:tetratricopeptide (TPR) repeat protein